jgi:transcriptional regulator of arginine metabolism
MSKLTRQQLIRQVVEERAVPSQDDLRRALKKQGMSVAQATLSRDIRELGLLKTPEGYSFPQNGQVLEMALPSVARLMAAALDAEGWPEAVGSLAGDDTILIIATSKKSAAKLAARIREMLA